MLDRDAIGRQIDLLQRLHAWLDRETAAVRRVRASWDLGERELLWTVVLSGVLEPDVDIELLEQVVVVRAREERGEGALLQALLPAPDPFDTGHAQVRFRAGVPEVRILRRGADR